MSSRAKKAAETIRVPANAEEASVMLAEIGRQQREILLQKAAVEEAVAGFRATAERVAADCTKRIADLQRGLEAWATVNRAVLTRNGRTKSIVLPSGTLSWEKGRLKLKLSGGKPGMEALIAAIREQGLTRFLREKVSLDRNAMLKERAVAATLPHVGFGGEAELFVAKPVVAPVAPPAGG